MQKITLFIQGGGSTGLNMPETFLRSFNDLFSRQALTSAALAVGTTTSKFKVGTAAYVVINGVTQLVAVGDGPVLTGYNLTAAQIGGFVAAVDANGVLYALPINPAASIGAIGYPQVPAGLVALGVVLINTVNAAIYTGGTSVMSGSNVVYINLTGPFSPTNAF